MLYLFVYLLFACLLICLFFRFVGAATTFTPASASSRDLPISSRFDVCVSAFHFLPAGHSACVCVYVSLKSGLLLPSVATTTHIHTVYSWVPCCKVLHIQNSLPTSNGSSNIGTSQVKRRCVCYVNRRLFNTNVCASASVCTIHVNLMRMHCYSGCPKWMYSFVLYFWNFMVKNEKCCAMSNTIRRTQNPMQKLLAIGSTR